MFIKTGKYARNAPKLQFCPFLKFICYVFSSFEKCFLKLSSNRSLKLAHRKKKTFSQTEMCLHQEHYLPQRLVGNSMTFCDDAHVDMNFRPSRRDHRAPTLRRLCFCWRLSAVIYPGWFFFWEPKQNDLPSVKITARRAPALCSPIWGAIDMRLVFTAGRPLGPTLSPAFIFCIQILRLHLDSSDANLKLSSSGSGR